MHHEKKWPRKILGATSARKETSPGFFFLVTQDGISERGATRGTCNLVIFNFNDWSREVDSGEI